MNQPWDPSRQMDDPSAVLGAPGRVPMTMNALIPSQSAQPQTLMAASMGAPSSRDQETNDYVDHYRSTINDLMFFRDQIIRFKEESASKDDEGTGNESERQAVDCVAASQEFGEEAHHNFPTLLYNMLNSAEEDGIDRIVSWLPHGRAFRIYDRSRFETEVMPK